MLDELKNELEKTYKRKIRDRGDCEALVQDIYEKTGAVMSYNTIRRMYGLAEFRKPRESTLDYLSKYCGFQSYKDFCQRYSEIDQWPTWEHLYVVLSEVDPQKTIDFLRLRKRQEDQFSLAFTIIVRELINRGDYAKLELIFNEPLFQYSVLPYDQVAQIGVLVGLHFRNFDNEQLESQLLLLPNFRDIVLKIFVDYNRLNGKYGRWIEFLSAQRELDNETKTFVTAILIWRNHLNQLSVPHLLLRQLPELSMEQHPILFGRLFGLKLLNSSSKKEQKKLISIMEDRLKSEVTKIGELLYIPVVQSFVLNSKPHDDLIINYQTLIHQISHWYHVSLVAIHRIYQVRILIRQKEFSKARVILENIPFGHIRHGYREFLDVYISFFRMKIAQGLAENFEQLHSDFTLNRKLLTYPIFTDAYFENYFEDEKSIN